MTSRLAAPDRAATICRLFYSGSLVVRGSGLADVVATGPRSEIGKMANRYNRWKQNRRGSRRRPPDWCVWPRWAEGP
jgi:magnesium-transporting ATPase (P-type)